MELDDDMNDVFGDAAPQNDTSMGFLGSIDLAETDNVRTCSWSSSEACDRSMMRSPVSSPIKPSAASASPKRGTSARRCAGS